jgi:dipeptidyl aminopeptidase/acylaminoacyl peptidase
MSRVMKRALWITAAALVLSSLAIGRMAYRHYADVRADFEPTPPTLLSQHPEQTGIATLQVVSFRSSEGLKLSGWYVPSQNRAAVVISHGTNADHSSMLSEVRILADAGFGVLAFDWPGSGSSEGRIQWSHSERQALAAAIDWLGSRPETDPAKIGGLGFSMGGYMLAGVAAQDTRLRAVVLQATPTDYRKLTLWQNRKWGTLSEYPALVALRDSGMPVSERRPIEVARNIAPRPVFIIHGDLDQTVPVAMARELYQASGDPKTLWIIAGAHHGKYEDSAGAEYRSRLVGFFADNLKP